MFEYLIRIEPRIYDRFLTVERNIKSASNSFYDSYLDMQEQFIKHIVMEAGIDYKSNETCGALLKKPEVKSLLIETLAVDEYTYNKLQDYTLKVNAHKHIIGFRQMIKPASRCGFNQRKILQVHVGIADCKREYDSEKDFSDVKPRRDRIRLNDFCTPLIRPLVLVGR